VIALVALTVVLILTTLFPGVLGGG